jgi:dimethylhistidine N-methyltransferase
MPAEALETSYSEFAREVREGLGKAGQKELPCGYFYDEVGTALFEAITVLPEYGLTRADARLIRRLSAELTGHMRRPPAVAELGSGAGSKTRWILETLAHQGPVTYFPIDLSASALARCARELALFGKVVPVEESYLSGLRGVVCNRQAIHPLLVLFLGSTIGNFERAQARDFLREIRASLMPGDALLLGTDLIQGPARMIQAYDDPIGLTAAFNLNLLARINRELEGDFILRNFAHEARWCEQQGRIEMHLRSTVEQAVCIRRAGFSFELREGETIWTESCHKFRAEEVRAMATGAGFDCAAQWIDEEWPFAESLLIA